MGMRRVLGVACLVVSVFLLAWALDASGSLGSALVRFFRRTPTHRTMELYLGGVISAVVGVGLLWRRPRKAS